MSHYALSLRGGSVASPYAAGYDYGPRRTHRYHPDGTLYGGVYTQRVHYHPVRAAPYHRKRESDVSFENAMSRLYGTLMDAVSFFKDFDSSFTNETSGIKPYATPAILDELWKNKVIPVEKGNNSHSARRTSSDGWEGSDEGSASGQSDGSLQEHLKLVLDEMSEATFFRTSLGGRGERGESVSSSDIDSLKRLQEKLAIQYGALHKISGKVHKVRKYFQEFIKESELVLIYMDKSRELWDLSHDNTEKGKERDEGSRPNNNSGETVFNH